MSEPSNILTPLQPVDLNSLRSQIQELRNVNEISELSPEDAEKLLRDVGVELESKISQVLSECSSNINSVPNEELTSLIIVNRGDFLGQLKEDLNALEDENADIECEIEDLSRRCAEDRDKLERELEKLSCSLEFIESQSLEKVKEDVETDISYHADDQENLSHAVDSNFKMLELSHQIQKNKATVKALKDLDSILQRFEAVEKIEEALTGIRVNEFEGNSIRLSLKTYIPNLESVLCQQVIECVIEPLELNHELIIETIDGTLELKNVEIFPNDVYIGEIIDAAKSFRVLYPSFSVISTRSSLEWFSRRVQDRIALSSLRRFVVRNTNKSRHSFEYLDKEDTIVAHVVGGVDAFIKLSQGWPLSNSTLELISLKSKSQHSKEISLSFLCKIVEMANSLNASIRQNLSGFVDSIEEILMKQMHAELQTDSITTM